MTDVMDKIKNQLLSLDPVYWCEKYLTLDGKPYRINKNGYKPFSDVLRYLGIKGLEKNSIPVIIVKGRQIGASTLASAAEMFFMGCGHFGTSTNPPMRVVHTFPFLDLASYYGKVKLSGMINDSIVDDSQAPIKGQKQRSHMQSLIDRSDPGNDNQTFKQFIGGNFVMVESVGVDGQRLRGKTADALFFDECFPYDQNIETIDGKRKIGSLYNDFIAGKELPLVKTYNEENDSFEYKHIVNAWNRGEKPLVSIMCGNKVIRCTSNHRFLTENGWVPANCLEQGDLLKTSNSTDLHVRALNDDQTQVVLGSFLGDGHLSTYKVGRYRLIETHSIKQEAYCKWKAAIFDVDTKSISENGFKKTPAVSFCTKAFGLPFDLPQKKTSCPQWVLDTIDARGIAVWFMDDGSIDRWNTGANGTLHTCSFDEDSQRRIVDKFKSLGIDCRYSYNKSSNGKRYHAIHFNKCGFAALCDLIRPYMHKNIAYKVSGSVDIPSIYKWNSQFKPYGLTVVDSVNDLGEIKEVYDIEVEDNHNFILAPSRRSPNTGGPIAHNCQDMPRAAIVNSSKILTQAQYGSTGSGIQFYFGTPKQRGSAFYDMWNTSSQQYYYLGCEKCKKHFPLYTPGSDEWEGIWLYGFIVRCTHCGFEQDKRDAAERGKWVATKDPNDCQMVGFHMNQLYMPNFSKEKILSEKPGTSAINTERGYQNEVLGEFYHGEAAIITPEQVRDMCGDPQRKFRASISPAEDMLVFLGIDIGAKNDLEQLVDSDRVKPQGQSYSTAVVIAMTGPNRMSIEFATKFKRNDIASKKGLIDQIMRTYSCNLAVCDIGFAGDLNEILQTEYGDKFLSSQSLPRVNDHIKFNQQVFPKILAFEKDYWIADLYEQMKKGSIRFPLGDYEKIAWLIQHCTSMEIKPSISRTGDITPHYVKGTQPNDGFMALLNAYIAYKFYVSNGFQIKNPLSMTDNQNRRPPILSGFVPRMR